MFILKVMFGYCFFSRYLQTQPSRSVCLWDFFRTRSLDSIPVLQNSPAYRDNVIKRTAVIRESVSPYPSKTSKRLPYFICEHYHGISRQWKIPQVKSNIGCHQFSWNGNFEFTIHNVYIGLHYICNKTPLEYLSVCVKSTKPLFKRKIL